MPLSFLFCLTFNYFNLLDFFLTLLPVNVNIPASLRQYTQNQSNLQVEASTVQEALQKLDGVFPGLRAFILNESSELRRYVNVFVNGKDIRQGDGITTKLKEGDQLRIVPAVAGG